MATLHLSSPITIAGTTYPHAKVIVLSPQRHNNVKTILPKTDTPPSSFATSTTQLCDIELPKRRIHFSKKALTHPRPQSVTRRNTRERNRAKAVNQGKQKTHLFK